MARERTNNSLLLNEFVQMLGPSVGDILGNGTNRMINRNANKIVVDIVNDEKTIYIYAEIPGASKESIDVDFFNNKMTITVEKVRPYDEPEVSEIKFGKFERVLTLPICVTRKDAVSVSFINGILRIKINKLVEEENKFSIKPTD
jgi:HSP20 family molecular chaperone IbpA